MVSPPIPVLLEGTVDRVVCGEDVFPDIPLVNRISWELEGSLIPPFLEPPYPTYS